MKHLCVYDSSQMHRLDPFSKDQDDTWAIQLPFSLNQIHSVMEGGAAESSHVIPCAVKQRLLGQNKVRNGTGVYYFF